MPHDPAPTSEESRKSEQANDRTQLAQIYRTYLRGNCPGAGLGRLLRGHGGSSESQES